MWLQALHRSSLQGSVHTRLNSANIALTMDHNCSAGQAGEQLSGTLGGGLKGRPAQGLPGRHLLPQQAPATALPSASGPPGASSSRISACAARRSRAGGCGMCMIPWRKHPAVTRCRCLVETSRRCQQARIDVLRAGLWLLSLQVIGVKIGKGGQPHRSPEDFQAMRVPCRRSRRCRDWQVVRQPHSSHS